MYKRKIHPLYSIIYCKNLFHWFWPHCFYCISLLVFSLSLSLFPLSFSISFSFTIKILFWFAIIFWFNFSLSLFLNFYSCKSLILIVFNSKLDRGKVFVILCRKSYCYTTSCKIFIFLNARYVVLNYWILLPCVWQPFSQEI